MHSGTESPSVSCDLTLCCTRDQVVNLASGRSAAQVQYVTLTTDERVELLWKRLCSVSRNVPSKDNFYLSLYLRGKRSGSVHVPTPVTLLPPYLTQDSFVKLKVFLWGLLILCLAGKMQTWI